MNTNTYHCRRMRPITTDGSATDAAEEFAGRMARREFGRRTGTVGALTPGAYSRDGRVHEFSAFIGRRTGRNEITGHNVHLTITRS